MTFKPENRPAVPRNRRGMTRKRPGDAAAARLGPLPEQAKPLLRAAATGSLRRRSPVAVRCSNHERQRWQYGEVDSAAWDSGGAETTPETACSAEKLLPDHWQS